ncbi:MAG: hypothetical protein MPJ24_02005 [Pirellulaceae bacterium]|nr:hypothetical protein [Pirellulaceae bacterium]
MWNNVVLGAVDLPGKVGALWSYGLRQLNSLGMNEWLFIFAIILVLGFVLMRGEGISKGF